ncbi:hypothetical protein QFZ66_000208 [Streptomyces sp. B4I13]|nr:hypothetical protein [Streptomyces sp. B4I13]
MGYGFRTAEGPGGLGLLCGRTTTAKEPAR